MDISDNRSGFPAAACNPVSIKPGATALTLIPSSATSLAKPRVRLSMAPFVAA
ncbi:hypothetical protein C4K40_4229 [Pseudomonas sp. CMR5c]|nr:hypothetical protein C4K40_4229 [Pseudomonas sp. CMR5c]